MEVRAITLAPLMIIALSATAAPDVEPATVPIRVTLYQRDAAGKRSVAPNIKLHVTKLDVDPITKSDGAVQFRVLPGNHTLTTVTGTICHFKFKVDPGKAMDISLIIPAVKGSCQYADPEALTGPETAGNGRAAASAAR